MITKMRMLYGHAWFAREGISWTSPGAGGPVSADAKPPVDATDGSNPLLVHLGPATIKVSTSIGIRKESRIGAPGRLVRKDIKGGKKDIDYNVTLDDLSDLPFQLLFGTADLGLNPAAADVTIHPQQGKPIVKGWLFIRTYDDENNPVYYLDQWCAAEYDGEMVQDGESTENSLKFSDLYSKYNTGLLNPSA